MKFKDYLAEATQYVIYSKKIGDVSCLTRFIQAINMPIIKSEIKEMKGYVWFLSQNDAQYATKVFYQMFSENPLTSKEVWPDAEEYCNGVLQ